MDADLTLTLIDATVQIDQPVNDQKRMVGTGFLVSVPREGAAPEVVLVTAAHVFERMPANEVRIGWRVKAPNGGWQYSPSRIAIRNDKGPLWTQNPKQDVAVIPVTVPPSYKDKAIPLEWLANEKTFEQMHVGPGDEMMTLGYPHGYSANTIGFPILRAGRLASYPLGPATSFPTFLIDLTAIPGNSGGPVFMTEKASRAPDTEMPSVTLVSGILTKQVEVDGQRLELALVTHAIFVRQTIEQLYATRGQGTGVKVGITLTTPPPAPVKPPEPTPKPPAKEASAEKKKRSPVVTGRFAKANNPAQ
ncbi:serine protease [Asticcacaulis sp. YBE204]|uniref:trypsin-like serine peptidase n=1 Tax=Asticcacaulis sp. YBE204 TaxID=1282363 RepID=UPI0003C4035E|nr:serine protease [Asticcacaulis sp. YBE204]ESQ78836.1 hypothetical protein AEYBE204_12700 [Asticcacaulis sp. YBE204]